MTLRIVPCAALALGIMAGVTATAQQAMVTSDLDETRKALFHAQAQGASARERAERLEAEARRVTAAAERTANETAAIAARIQETESESSEHQARMSLIARQRKLLRNRLAQKQQPVVRLTAAIQRLSRRPPVLALLRPGSVRDAMYMRALLETIVPEVERRTAALRQEIERGRELEQRALAAAQALRKSESRLVERRQSLVAVETRQRLASRQASSVASREADRALALSEEARDLEGLMQELGKAGHLREALEQLPGPLLRPVRPEDSRVTIQTARASGAPRLAAYLLPVNGRLVAGFGETTEGALRSEGITLATRPGAQAVAPAAGRVAFAGHYRGYGRIVIIEHPGELTTLITGLAQLDTRVGATLVPGSPLGITGGGNPVVTVELRRGGKPVNPLLQIGAL